MNKLGFYLQEARIKQWSKNLIVFLPAFFGAAIFDLNLFFHTLLAFISFCFAASIVYVINDIRDFEEDRLHPEKKHRPIASGDLKKKDALFFLSFLIVILSLLIFSTSRSIPDIFTIIVIYLTLNLLYSFGLKKIPYLEIFVVSIFYLLRLKAGGIASGIEISIWLNAVVFFGAMLFITGKRYTEKRRSDTRSVLKKYSLNKLWIGLLSVAGLTSIFMMVYGFLQGVFYIPQSILFIAALIRYIFLIENTNKGESATIFLDKILLTIISLFILYSFLVIYL